MKKRLIRLLLTLCLATTAVSFVPATTAYAYTQDDGVAMVKLVNSLIEQGVPKDVIINYTSDCAEPVECREKIQAGIDSGYFDQYISGSTATTPEPETPAETKPEHTHNYIANLTKDPTCTEEGEMTYTCECGDSYIEPYPVIDHQYEGVVTKEAACAEEGEMTYTCTMCGDTYTDRQDRAYTRSSTDGCRSHLHGRGL